MIVKTATALLFYLLYRFCCFLGTGPDKKNLNGLRSYPDDAQQAGRKDKELSKIAVKEAIAFGFSMVYI